MGLFPSPDMSFPPDGAGNLPSFSSLQKYLPSSTRSHWSPGLEPLPPHRPPTSHPPKSSSARGTRCLAPAITHGLPPGRFGVTPGAGWACFRRGHVCSISPGGAPGGCPPCAAANKPAGLTVSIAQWACPACPRHTGADQATESRDGPAEADTVPRLAGPGPAEQLPPGPPVRAGPGKGGHNGPLSPVLITTVRFGIFKQCTFTECEVGPGRPKEAGPPINV